MNEPMNCPCCGGPLFTCACDVTLSDLHPPRLVWTKCDDPEHKGLTAEPDYTDAEYQAAQDIMRSLREKLIDSPKAKAAYDRVMVEIDARREAKAQGKALKSEGVDNQ